MQIYITRILDISDKKLNELCLLIDPEKRCKIVKFINRKDKIKTLIGEILIRTIIVEKLKIKNKYIKFFQNQYGKPFLKGNPTFNFNISHSGDYVVCGIDDNLIGIDVEEIRPFKYKEIVSRFFASDEVDYINKFNIDLQLNKFYEIWTLKESYIKCCGQGLSIPLNSFSINQNSYGEIEVIGNNKNKEFKFKKFNIETSYKLAICSENGEINNNIRRVDQNSLIDEYFRINME